MHREMRVRHCHMSINRDSGLNRRRLAHGGDPGARQPAKNAG